MNDPSEDPMWPNNAGWSAGRNNVKVETESGDYFLWVIDCGSLVVTSGKLAVCDPFAAMVAGNNPHIITPIGQFPVTVTLADVSESLDRSHVREAYASIHFAQGVESYRRTLVLAKEGEDRTPLNEDEFRGFRVDAGTGCFVDDAALETCMPDSENWLEDLFENDRSDCWFARMDDPNHIREGLANIRLPLARNSENLILFHSGWGDGVFPVVGSYDNNDQLLAVHVDLLVIP